jgi:DNA-binding transcriptional ArsR family regulator
VRDAERDASAAPGEGAAETAAEGQAARFFQALADSTRLDILDRLRREGEATVGELVDALGCPQPKVSRHLKVLKESGLVLDRREGRNVTYALAAPKLWPAEAREWVERLDAGILPPEMEPPHGRAGGEGRTRRPAKVKPPRHREPAIHLL